MLELIGKAFKWIFSTIIIIAFLVILIFGMVLMERGSPELGLLVLCVGLFVIILSAGLISIFINIDKNIQEQKELLEQFLTNKYGFQKKENIKNIECFVNKSTPLKNGPSNDTETIKIIEFGSFVKYISSNNPDWYFVETNTGDKGFCLSTNLKKI